MKTYNCLHCGKECTWTRNKFNKYCGFSCQQLFTWETVTKPRVERGECTHNSAEVLKKYLRGTVGDECEQCGQLPQHNGKPLVLQLDHIDGDSDNNFPKNLRLLCPNCHTQTDNFGSKGKGSRYKKFSKRNQYLQEFKKV